MPRAGTKLRPDPRKLAALRAFKPFKTSTGRFDLPEGGPGFHRSKLEKPSSWLFVRCADRFSPTHIRAGQVDKAVEALAQAVVDGARHVVREALGQDAFLFGDGALQDVGLAALVPFLG